MGTTATVVRKSMETHSGQVGLARILRGGVGMDEIVG